MPAKAARWPIAVVAAVVALLGFAGSPAAANGCTRLGGGARAGSCGEDAPPAHDREQERSPAETSRPRAGRDTAGSARLLQLVNDERGAAGLAPLAVRREIDDVAWGHSEAMAQAGDIWHNDAYFTAETRRRLGARALGENVARNATVEDAHARLMASPGHRANILDARFNQVGVSVVRDGAGSLFITEDFAAVPPPEPAQAPAPPGPPPAPPAPAPPPAPPAPAPPSTTTASPAELSAGGTNDAALSDGPPAEVLVRPATAEDLVRPAAARALVPAAAAPGPSTGDAVLAAGVCALCALGLVDRRRRALGQARGFTLSTSTLSEVGAT